MPLKIKIKISGFMWQKQNLRRPKAILMVDREISNMLLIMDKAIQIKLIMQFLYVIKVYKRHTKYPTVKI
jgi:hypothetical protein